MRGKTNIGLYSGVPLNAETEEMIVSEKGMVVSGDFVEYIKIYENQQSKYIKRQQQKFTGPTSFSLSNGKQITFYGMLSAQIDEIIDNKVESKKYKVISLEDCRQFNIIQIEADRFLFITGKPNIASNTDLSGKVLLCEVKVHVDENTFDTHLIDTTLYSKKMFTDQYNYYLNATNFYDFCLFYLGDETVLICSMYTDINDKSAALIDLRTDEIIWAKNYISTYDEYNQRYYRFYPRLSINIESVNIEKKLIFCGDCTICFIDNGKTRDVLINRLKVNHYYSNGIHLGDNKILARFGDTLEMIKVKGDSVEVLSTNDTRPIDITIQDVYEKEESYGSLIRINDVIYRWYTCKYSKKHVNESERYAIGVKLILIRVDVDDEDNIIYQNYDVIFEQENGRNWNIDDCSIKYGELNEISQDKFMTFIFSNFKDYYEYLDYAYLVPLKIINGGLFSIDAFSPKVKVAETKINGVAKSTGLPGDKIEVYIPFKN